MAYRRLLRENIVRYIARSGTTTFHLKKGGARAKKTMHAPTALGGKGLHHLKEFWQALKVSWIKRLATSKSFWMQIFASQANVNIKTLRESDYLTVEILNKCRNSKNSFWHETFKSYSNI